MSGAISERAMLVKLNISRWTATKKDAQLNRDVARRHGSSEDWTNVTKRLVARDALEEIRKISAKARHHHYDNTLPWTDEGKRILPAALYFDYMKVQRDLQHQFESAVRRLVKAYPALKREAKKQLGTAFDERIYPEDDAIAALFVMGVEVESLPSADDFRVNIGEDEIAAQRDAIAERVRASVEAAMRDVWKRIHDTVQHMATSLREYEVTPDGVKNPFRDSLVNNIREMVDVLGKLNITGSNSLEMARKRLGEELGAIDAEVLRTDQNAREDVAKKAEAYLNDMSDFIS